MIPFPLTKLTTQLNRLSPPVRSVLAVAETALAPLAVLVAWLATSGDTPDPLPTHWNAAGDVDGTTDPAVFVGVCLAVAAGLTVAVAVGLAAGRARRAARGWVPILTGAAWLVGCVAVMVLTVSSGVRDAESAALPWWMVVLVVAVPWVGAYAAWATAPTDPRQDVAASSPSTPIRLADNERVTWYGTASSGRLAALGTALFLAGLAVSVFRPWVGLLVAVVGVAVLLVHQIRVRVDDRAVTVSSGLVRWPRLRVGIADVARAEARDIEPLRWGGWGYRITPRGRAVVVRRGEGVVLERRTGGRLAVTVDDAGQAADLVNALVARRPGQKA